jgi:hypothetical protein
MLENSLNNEEQARYFRANTQCSEVSRMAGKSGAAGFSMNAARHAFS